MNLALTFTMDALKRNERDLFDLQILENNLINKKRELETRQEDLMRQLEWLKTNPEGR